MFSRILVAVDGSESAKKAFEMSVYTAQRFNAKLDVLHVVLDSTYSGDSAVAFDLIEELKEKGKKLLEQCEYEATRNNVQVKTFLKIGDHAQVIIDTANKNNYDLIMMGSRGLGVFKELLLGSVSFKVLHHAKCPVMVIR